MFSYLIGMFCRLCMTFNIQSRNNLGVWTRVPCTRLNKQSIDSHRQTEGHKKAVGLERDAKENVNLMNLVEKEISVQRLAIEGALRCIYWLAKNELPHTTKFRSLVDFVKSMGCEYMTHLNQASFMIFFVYFFSCVFF